MRDDGGKRRGEREAMSNDPHHRYAGHAPQARINGRFLIEVARRWWRLALPPAIVLGMLGGALGYRFYTPRYEATTWLRVTPIYIVFKEPFEAQEFARNQQELIKSPPVLEAALKNPAVEKLVSIRAQKDPVAWLRKRLETKTMDNTEIFTIKLVSEYRDGVGAVVNAVRDSYLQLKSRENSDQNQKLVDSLEKVRSAQQEKIRELQSKIRQLAAKTDSVPRKRRTEDNAAVRPVDQWLKTYSELEYKVLVAEAELRVRQDQLRGAAPLSDADLRTLKETHKGSTDKIEELLQAREQERNTPAGSQWVRPQLRDRINAMEAELSDLGRMKVKEEESTLQARLKIDRATLATLKTKLEQARKEAEGRNVGSVELDWLQEEENVEQGILTSIVQRMAQLSTESHAGNRVEVLKKAVEPTKAMEDGGPMKLALFGALAGFLFPLGFVVLREYLRQPIASSSDLGRATWLPIIGEIAVVPRTPVGEGASMRREIAAARFQESVDYLRVSILTAADNNDIRSIAVCSARPREGKTTLASNLAMSFARSGAGRVLLIDADLRCPRLQDVIGTAGRYGLVDALSGRCRFEECPVRTRFEGLDFVSAGALVGSAAALLTDGRFDRFLDAAKLRYEYVIVDTPPLLPVSDGIVIGGAVDGAVLCALRDVSTAGQVSRARQRLAAAGVRVLGAVLNGAPSSTFGSADYYYSRPKKRAQALNGSLSRRT